MTFLVEDYIMRSPPCTAIYHAFVPNADGPVAPAFLIREDQEHLSFLRQGFEVSSATGVLLHKNVLLVPMLLSIHGGRLHEFWYNHYQAAEADYCTLFGTSQALYLLFYSADCRVLKAPMQNPYQAAFQEILKRIQGHQPWSMSDFDAARAELYERFPKPDDLWEYLLDSKDLFQELS